MSVRTNDPRPPEIYKPALCAAGCGKEYESICGKCNLAYCLDHLKAEHACGNWPATRLATPEPPPPPPAPGKWPPLDKGTRVRTTSEDNRDAWMPEALVARKWGVTGTIIMHHDSHGLCYDVKHDDGTEGCYDPTEFDVLNGGERPEDAPQYAVGQQLAPGLVVVHEETLARLRGPFTCGHPPEYAGGACAACHAFALEKLDAVNLQVDELRKWVTEYGHHDSGCGAHPNQRRTSCEGRCDCGWAEIKEKFIEKPINENAAGAASQAGLPLEPKAPVAENRVDEPRYCVKCGVRQKLSDSAHAFICTGTKGNAANPAPFIE